jgi:hypothetical protein
MKFVSIILRAGQTHSKKTKGAATKKILSLPSVFIFLQKTLKNKVLEPWQRKFFSISPKESPRTVKISGSCNFYGGCNYNIYRSQFI